MWLDGEVVHIDGHRLVDAGKQDVYDYKGRVLPRFALSFFARLFVVELVWQGWEPVMLKPIPVGDLND